MSGDADFLHALKIAQYLKKLITVFALENRIPYRFSYIYQTCIFRFGKKLKIDFNKHQKVKLISLSEKIVGSI